MLVVAVILVLLFVPVCVDPVVVPDLLGQVGGDRHLEQVHEDEDAADAGQSAAPRLQPPGHLLGTPVPAGRVKEREEDGQSCVVDFKEKLRMARNAT